MEKQFEISFQMSPFLAICQNEQYLLKTQGWIYPARKIRQNIKYFDVKVPWGSFFAEDEKSWIFLKRGYIKILIVIMRNTGI